VSMLPQLHSCYCMGVVRVPKATQIPSKEKNYKAKKITFYFIKLHSELQWRRNALNVLCYKSTDLTPLALMQLLTDLPPLQHGDLTF